MDKIYNLNEIAKTFCGAILFDGEGNAQVVTTTECFSFENVTSIDEDEVLVTFKECNGIDLDDFKLDDLPHTVKDLDIIYSSFVKEMQNLSKSQRRDLLQRIEEFKDV